MKKYLIMLLLSLLGCGGGSGSGAGVSGIDLSGSYDNGRVICLQSISPFNVTKSAFIDGYSVFSITGNSYQSRYSYSGCAVSISARIVFSDESNYEISNINVTEATGGSCTISMAITGESGSGGAIVGLPTVTYVEGLDPSPAASNNYGYDTGEIAIFAPTITTSGSSPADLCYFVYDKI